MNADPVVRQYYPTTLTEAQSHQWAEKAQQQLDTLAYGFWAVALKPNPEQFIGFVGLATPTWQPPFPINHPPCVEIGWMIHPDHWGQGYATEAAQAALHYGLQVLGLPEIVSFTTQTNVRSQRVMEKIGMSRTPSDDFLHPQLDPAHPLAPHVLYRLRLNPS